MITSLILGALIQTGKPFDYKIGVQEFEGYLAVSSDPKAPFVFVVHDWNGLNDHEIEVCNQLAKEGLNAFAIDVYGKGVRPTTPQDCSKEASKYYGNPELFMSRLVGGIEHSPATGKKYAIGYCFGGTAVLELARRNLGGLTGVGSFHGGLKPLGNSKPVGSVDVAIFHGEADKSVSLQDLENAKAEFSDGRKFFSEVYKDGVHGFCVKGPRYSEAAAIKSWNDWKSFLSKSAL